MNLRDVIIQICTQPIGSIDGSPLDVYFDQNKKMIEIERENKESRLEVVKTKTNGVLEMRRISNG